MATEYHERCIKCKWIAPKLSPPCGRVFEMDLLIGPYGGTIEIKFVPGMVPEKFEKDLEKYLAKAAEWLCAVIEKNPIWDWIGEYQKENSEAAECPGRIETKNPFLRIV